LFVLVSFLYIFLLRVLDKAEYSAFESTLNSAIVSYRRGGLRTDPRTGDSMAHYKLHEAIIMRRC